MSRVSEGEAYHTPPGREEPMLLTPERPWHGASSKEKGERRKEISSSEDSISVVHLLREEAYHALLQGREGMECSTHQGRGNTSKNSSFQGLTARPVKTPMVIASPPLTGLTGAFQGIFIEPLHTEESMLFSKGEEACNARLNRGEASICSIRQRRGMQCSTPERRNISLPLFPQSQGGPSVGSHLSLTRSSITYLSLTRSSITYLSLTRSSITYLSLTRSNISIPLSYRVESLNTSPKRTGKREGTLSESL